MGVEGCFAAAARVADDDGDAAADDAVANDDVADGVPFGMNSDPPRQRQPQLQPLPALPWAAHDAVDHVQGFPHPPLPSPRRWLACYAMRGSATRDLRDIWKDSAACLDICHCLQVSLCRLLGPRLPVNGRNVWVLNFALTLLRLCRQFGVNDSLIKSTQLSEM